MKKFILTLLLFPVLSWGCETVDECRPLAEAGVAYAQFNLGYLYENGQGIPQHYAEGVKWYRKAAEQGYAQAQHNLGQMYRQGRGVPQDDA